MNNDFEHDEMSEFEEPTTMQKFKEWTQENLRIIVSILIVLLIASSIYSYSKRGEESTELAQEDTELESILGDIDSVKDSEEESLAIEENNKPQENKQEEAKKEEPKKEEVKTEVAQKTSESQETETSFIESAQAGDGTTHLARKALAHYLEKNSDSSLTAEHKIYIEDYLRKNISRKGHLSIGESVEFSKDLIKQAISASKNLNEGQLKNLQKYSANVNF